MRTAGLVVVVALSWSSGCRGDDGEDAAATDGSSASGDDTTGGDSDGGAMLGCAADGACTLLLVSQTLDDRVEILSPEAPQDRGAIDLDLKPNACEGCDPGDNGDDRLDEPFGIVRAGGFLHVIVGHYPTRELGTLLSFPLPFFEERPAGDRVPLDAFFSGGTFTDVIETPLGQLEPIYLTAHAGKLLVGTFNNDLFVTEDAWTQPGRLLVLDASDPSAGVGVVDLATLEGGACNGAGQVAVLSDDRVAVACDGNEAVAVLDVSQIADAAPTDAAASITGQLCDLFFATDSTRVRHVAGDGAGGFIVLEGPGAFDLLGEARIWRFGLDGDACAMKSVTPLAADGDWQLGQIEQLPGVDATWLFTSGSVSATGPNRGVFVAQGGESEELAICGPIAGFDAHLVDGQGDPLEPTALAITGDGSAIAVGAGPFMTQQAAPGFGKVLWGELTGVSDPCTMTASVTDLTGSAPAVDAADPSTWRRAPAVVTLVELGG